MVITGSLVFKSTVSRISLAKVLKSSLTMRPSDSLSLLQDFHKSPPRSGGSSDLQYRITSSTRFTSASISWKQGMSMASILSTAALLVLTTSAILALASSTLPERAWKSFREKAPTKPIRSLIAISVPRLMACLFWRLLRAATVRSNASGSSLRVSKALSNSAPQSCTFFSTTCTLSTPKEMASVLRASMRPFIWLSSVSMSKPVFARHLYITTLAQRLMTTSVISRRLVRIPDFMKTLVLPHLYWHSPSALNSG
mmetsp:Transcript_22715/g.49941  ORF Transcript_22715/g.49941 Transcript_22715/m.49941 type:complete len:255 (+) Transcript_22715:2833-3597(+)